MGHPAFWRKHCFFGLDVFSYAICPQERYALLKPAPKKILDKGEKVSASRDQLVAQLQALSLQKHLGIDVSEQVKQVLQRCQSEEDRKLLTQLCNAFGLSY
jgi:hypothetical protein